MVGALQYLTFKHPNIVFSVSRLSQFMHKPTIAHLVAVKHVLHFIAGTIDHDICF